MATFRGLTADRQPLEAFRECIPNSPKKCNATDNSLPLHIFEWSSDHPLGTEATGFMEPGDVQSREAASIRVIFAPQDVPHPATIDGMYQFLVLHEIPSAFITEGMQGVSQSFSARREAEGRCIWFHLLCKDIATSNDQIIHLPGHENGDRQSKDRLLAQNQSQANFTWLKPGFVLRIRGKMGSPPQPIRTTTSSSDSTLMTVTDKQPEVELFCFGAPVTLRDRFRKLKDIATCDELLQDPYVLLEVVMSEMYKVMDRTGWAIADIFGKIETWTLEISSNPGKAAKTQPDFQGLHNLAKHTIYLRENCEAALATLDDLRDHHKAMFGERVSPAQEDTRQGLKYQKSLFQSTQRRLASLDSRISNLVQLSFHIVTQGDSRVMQSENQSMKTIAVMTLIFMPLSTVAGIFGTQFMKLDEGPGHRITVSKDFWLMWLIAVPLTIIVIVMWRVWYADAKKRLTGEIPRDAERYMGWKTLRQTLRGSEEGKKGQYAVVTREATGKCEEA